MENFEKVANHPEPFEIERTIVFSTAHVTEKDMEQLEHNKTLPLSVYDYEYGAIVYVPEDKEDLDGYIAASDKCLSKAFFNLLRIAQEAKVKFLKLDCDGVKYDSLEAYEW